VADPAGSKRLELGLMISLSHAGSDECNLGGGDGGGERDHGGGDSEGGRGGGGGGSVVGDSNDGDDSAGNGFDCSDRDRYGGAGAPSSGNVAAQAGGIAVDDRANVNVGGGADHGPDMPRLAIKPGSEDHHELMVGNSNAVVAYKNRGLAVSKAVLYFAAERRR